MKLQLKKINLEKISLWNLYVVSMVVTMIFLFAKKRELLMQTSLFDEDSLKSLRDQITAGSTSFLFVLKERITIIIALFLLSTTDFGRWFVYANVLWYGAGTGLFFTIALLRYGIKGILLLVAGMFPHYLIYVPALILTLHVSEEKRTINRKLCVQLLVIIIVVITGCILECYVNPQVLTKVITKVLKIL